MRRALKTLLLVALLVGHTLCGLCVRFFVRGRLAFLRICIREVSKHSRWALRIFGVEVVVENAHLAREGQNYFIVSNHMSYLDVLPIAAFRKSAFVTSMEMKEDPLLGPITEVGGCLYVERRSKENILNEIGEIEMALRNGLNVVVFPEATSTDGSSLRPFKRPLFAAAARAQIPVLPIVIHYEQIDGEPVTTANRDSLCWYGTMPFGPHFLGLMNFHHVRIRLEILPEIATHADSSRDTLMDAAEAAIRARFRPIPPPSSSSHPSRSPSPNLPKGTS